MAKHGVVAVNAETGDATFTEGAGVLKYATDALSTLVATDRAVVGYGSIVQKVALFLGGNMVGVHSTTGRLGIGALRKNIYFGK